MTYTFDDAIKELEKEVFWTTGFPELPEIEFEKVKAVLGKLREEYAPTVEMTEEQKFYWEKANESNFSTLDKETTSGLFVAGMPEEKTKLTLTVRQSINAVLHPETIKVVDE